MITRPRTRNRYRNAAGVVLMVLLPGLYHSGSLAGELSETPAAVAPALNLPDLSGRQRNLDEFSGRMVLVNFWASWCTPCLEEMPGIRHLAEAMRGKPFVVIGVNVGDTRPRVQATMQRLDIDFTVLLDTDSAVFKDWGAGVLPTSYILDRNGRIRFIGRGPLEWDRADIVEMLVELAGE